MSLNKSINDSLRYLIGKPVTSCLKAQVMAGDASYRYVRDAGFNHSKEFLKLLDIATVCFEFKQNGIKRKMTVPLLTIVPVPTLQIKQASLSFIANITDVSNDVLTVTYGNATGNGWGYNQDTRYAGQMKFKVVAQKHELSLGIKKLLGAYITNGIRKNDLDPNKYNFRTKEKVDAIGILMRDLMAARNKKLKGLLDSLILNKEELQPKSEIFQKYLELRKLPINKRASMPYMTIERNGRIIYTDCCRADHEYLDLDFSSLLQEYQKYTLNDIIDAEDIIAATYSGTNIESLIYLFGSSDESKGEFVGMIEDSITNMLKQLKVNFDKNVLIKKLASKFSFNLQSHNCLIDCIPIPTGNEMPDQTKYNNCIKEDIHLLTFANEFIYGHERLVKSTIASKLGLCTFRYQARQCDVYELSKDNAEMFLNAYHFQGYTEAYIHLGLGYKGKLVEVLSFKQLNVSYEYEIVRLATRHMCHVIGGVSKLIKHFCRNNICKSLTVYASNDLGKGCLNESAVPSATQNVFLKLGFELKETMPPGYGNSIYGMQKLITKTISSNILDIEHPNKDESQKPSSEIGNDNSPISGIFKKYLELRKLPIRERASMPYKTLEQNGHIIYTDCCRIDFK